VTSGRQDPNHEYLTGFRAPVYQALWRRILMWGGPRVLSGVWVAVCLYLALLMLFLQRPLWIIAVAVGWLLVQAAIILITQWDEYFDAVLLVSPKYKSFYDAG
jgi:type IV secretory pathway TrbD component